jgi:hypothetical protein
MRGAGRKLRCTSDSKSTMTLECNRGWLRGKAIQVALTPALAEDPSITPASRGHDIRGAQPMTLQDRAETDAEPDAELPYKFFESIS